MSETSGNRATYRKSRIHNKVWFIELEGRRVAETFNGDNAERISNEINSIFTASDATILSLRGEVERLTGAQKERHLRDFKYNPLPWSVVGNANDGYHIADANGQNVLMLLWPIHPADETEAVEKEAQVIADFIAHSAAWLTATALDFFEMEARAERAEAALRLAQPYVENFMAEEGTEEADEALDAMFAVQAVLAPLASLTREG